MKQRGEVMDDREVALNIAGRQQCWDHDLDGWCPLCHGDPDRCPRTAGGRDLAVETTDRTEDR